jgi:response regulator RpfG family c-di-GMP phosphodiesterase
MNQRDLPRVLCVDDESRVIEALVLNLRKSYQLFTALSGDEALKTLKRIGGAAVVISDMRMPGMDGATFLNNVMHLFPETSRILLTGEPGRDAAVSAVNKGHIFHFLTKPCSPDELKAAVEAGVTRHQLLNVEQALLKETLNGCIKTLMDVLALTNAVAFGRAARIRQQSMEFAAALGYRDYWQLEAAAMLMHIGHLSFPAELLEKIYHGKKLTPQEAITANRAPDIVGSVLEKVPRLGPVVQILTALNWTDQQITRLGDGTIGIGTRILGLVLSYDALIAQGHSVDVAIQVLKGRSVRFGESLVEQFAAHLDTKSPERELRTIPLHTARTGMIIMEDVHGPSGTLLIPRGFEVTELFLERARILEPDVLNMPVKALVRSTPESAED